MSKGYEYTKPSLSGNEMPNYMDLKPEPFSMSKYLYNRKEKSVLGRNASSWAKIGIFYSIFYGVLAALVALCMIVFMQTIDPRIPKWQLDQSLIGTNPGLGYRPMPPVENVLSTLIWYKGTSYENYRLWTETLDKFLDTYKVPGKAEGKGEHITHCSYTSPPSENHVCDVNINDFKPCIKENNYNYHKSSPCIFLKLNKIYGWIPEYYNSSKDLPKSMPKTLIELIADIETKDKFQLNTIWVSCDGENPADVENIGPVAYYPRQGFPGYYYPYKNSLGYLSPLVAVHFIRPVHGIIINVECKAWARNIKYDKKEKMGSLHFELMID